MYRPTFLSGCLCVFLAAATTTIGCGSSDGQSGDYPGTQADIFAVTCARCHGVNGTGGIPGADGTPAPRNFHDTLFQKTRTDDDIRKTIINGKGGVMPSFGKTFSDDELKALVARVRGFDPRRNNDESR